LLSFPHWRKNGTHPGEVLEKLEVKASKKKNLSAFQEGTSNVSAISRFAYLDNVRTLPTAAYGLIKIWNLI